MLLLKRITITTAIMMFMIWIMTAIGEKSLDNNKKANANLVDRTTAYIAAHNCKVIEVGSRDGTGYMCNEDGIKRYNILGNN